MNHEEAVEKAVKFLKLAKSDNPNEAALAAAKAQEIIERFKLDIGSLEAPMPERPKEEVKDFGFGQALYTSGKLQTWRARLAQHLAEVNACKSYYRGSNIHLIGRPSDVQTVRYLFSMLNTAVDDLVYKSGFQGLGRSYLNNFRLGVVDTIGRRLREQVKAVREEAKTNALAQDNQAGTTTALARINKALARLDEDVRETEAWTQQHMKFTGVRRTGQWRGNAEAREAGRRAGETVNLGGQARGGLGAGA